MELLQQILMPFMSPNQQHRSNSDINSSYTVSTTLLTHFNVRQSFLHRDYRTTVKQLLTVPRSKTMLGRRRFSVSAPCV